MITDLRRTHLESLDASFWTSSNKDDSTPLLLKDEPAVEPNAHETPPNTNDTMSNIKNVTPQVLTSTTVLDISYNFLRTFPLPSTQYTSLVTLSLAGNRLNDIPSPLNCFPNLKCLKLANNAISSLKGLEDSHQNGAKLEIIDLSQNCIEIIDFPSQCAFKNLKELYLSSNCIKDIQSPSVFPKRQINPNHENRKRKRDQVFTGVPKLLLLSVQGNRKLGKDGLEQIVLAAPMLKVIFANNIGMNDDDIEKILPAHTKYFV